MQSCPQGTYGITLSEVKRISVMEEKICPSCQHNNLSKNFFCTQCGSKLLTNKYKRSRLHILTGESEGAIFLLREGRNTIGRDGGNLVVLGDEKISNKHAAIVFEDGQYWIKDLQSKNGVFVNGAKVGVAERLVNGSIIELGSTLLRFELNGTK